jgi:hypothetical protein
MSGSTITTWINRGSGYVQQCQATDTTFTSGKPGIGFYNQGLADNTQFGFSDFTATAKELTPSAPVNLRIVP